MKKKLFSFVLAFAFVLTAGICLTACGGDNYPGVSLFSKTYTFSEQATYSAKINMGNDSVSDWEQWIKDNWTSSYRFGDTTLDTSKTSAEDLISYIKSDAFITNLSGYKVLKGAIVEIGAGTPTEINNEKKGDFKVRWGENESIDTFILSSSSENDYPLYYNGKIEGNGYFGYGFDFSIKDFNYKKGTMSGAEFSFYSGDNDNCIKYSNSHSVALIFGTAEENPIDIIISYDCINISAK